MYVIYLNDQSEIYVFTISIHTEGFQYFSSVPVLQYLQAVLCIKILTFSSYTINTL